VARIPGLGEHTHALLESLGFDAKARTALSAAAAVPAEEGRHRS
jgi:hypothetical protein